MINYIPICKLSSIATHPPPPTPHPNPQPNPTTQAIPDPTHPKPPTTPHPPPYPHPYPHPTHPNHPPLSTPPTPNPHPIFRLCNWLSMRRLVSSINHLPPTYWSTFWKSIFKQQLGCRCDITDSISYFFVFCHMQLYMSWYIISFLALSSLLEYSFFQVLLY